MVLTRKQKAAMLLASLDPGTASELLKGLAVHVVQDLAVEMAYLDSTGGRSPKVLAEVTQQFCESLNPKGSFQLDHFLDEMLKNTVGQDKGRQIQTEIRQSLQKRDPFMPLRSTGSQKIAAVLEHEHPKAAAVVLSELPAKKSSEVLGLLGESVRMAVISRITTCDTVTAEAKTRIAEAMSSRLKTLTSGQQPQSEGGGEQSLRKVAVILRNTSSELRGGLLETIGQTDSKASAKVAELMIIWEDIREIADRPLQEALRSMDPKVLALALHKADEDIIGKVRSNVSERMAGTMDEEASLMSTPSDAEVKEARDDIVGVLREMYANEKLTFAEE